MSAHNTPYHLYQAPLSQDPQKGTTGTIVIDRNPCYVPVDTTAGAAALTLARPTKKGIVAWICLEVDSGDLTLTVTGGYNYDEETSITIADVGGWIMLSSIEIGGTKRWQIVAQEKTTAAMEEGAFDTATIAALAHTTTDLAEHATGAIGTGIAPVTNRYTRDGVIVTDIKIDMTGLVSKNTANDIIGKGAVAAYIGRNVVATNGVIFRIEMICLEVPATGDTDINLVSGSAADDEYDEAVTGAAVEINGGTWAAGTVVQTLIPAVAANYYFYLTTGAGATAGTYTTGQFLIRLYGHALLA